MIDQDARIRMVIRDELKKNALGEAVGFAVSQAFAPVPVPGQPGQMTLGPVWLITVTIPNPMLGYTDIGMTVPLPGVMPPDVAFRQIAARLLEDCRTEKDKILRGGPPNASA